MNHFSRCISSNECVAEIERSYYRKLWIDDGMKRAAYPSA